MLKQKRFITAALVLALLIITAGCARKGAEQAVAGKPAVADFSSPLRLSTINTDAAEPVAAAASDGNVYVAWVEHAAKRQADVLLTKLDASGKQVFPPVRVNTQAGQATAWRGDPPTIAVAKDGTIYVGWTARAAAEGHATNLFLSTSRDGGKTFEPPVKVNDDAKEVVHGMHSLAIDERGRVFLAWLDERSINMYDENGKLDEHKMEANREVYAASSEDGGRTFSQNRLVAREACPCCKTAVTAGADGRVYVAWRQVLPGNYRHIAVASSTDGGQTFSSPVIASDDRWMIAGCPVSGPALSLASDGALRVLWYSEGEAGKPGLYWSESRDGGKSFTSRKPLAEGTAFGNPQLLAGAGPGNSLTAIWESNQAGASKIIVARLDNTGVPKVSEIPSQGQLPSAVAIREQLYIAYITKENEQRSIWLVRAKATA
ncbi:MAG TPA: sialidase family protein [Pyrinomonadaceae bacterium]|nr:sialidase family protein [Pyrinomonadaceae bacterium]